MPDETARMVTVSFELSLGARAIEASIDLPDIPMRVADLLPAMFAFDDAFVAMAADQVPAPEKAVSCKPGCGACCRQLVPVSEAEAVYLAELVAGMEPERQQRLRERFRATIEALGADLVERLRNAAALDAGGRRQAGIVYFRKHAACPFLENENCSIYEHRPTTCREYIVTSPAENCRDPRAETIETIALPVKPSTVLYRFSDGMGQESTRWIPLVLALEWAANHSDERPPRFPAPAMFRNFVRQVAAAGAGGTKLDAMK